MRVNRLLLATLRSTVLATFAFVPTSQAQDQQPEVRMSPVEGLAHPPLAPFKNATPSKSAESQQSGPAPNTSTGGFQCHGPAQPCSWAVSVTPRQRHPSARCPLIPGSCHQ
jgi:hypothetical protein